MNTLDFRQLFEQSPGLLVVIDPNFKIVATSDGFLQATKTQRENIIGRGYLVSGACPNSLEICFVAEPNHLHSQTNGSWKGKT